MRRQQATAQWQLAEAERRRAVAYTLSLLATAVGIVIFFALVMVLLWLVAA